MTQPRLRVALLIDPAPLDGAGGSLLRIAERLDLRSVAPLVVLGHEGSLAWRLRASGLEVVVHPLAPAGRAARGLTDLLRARSIELVYTNSLKTHLIGGLAGRLAGKRVVWHVRDHVAAPDLPIAAVRAVRLAARTVPHAVVAGSTSVALTVGRSDAVILHQAIPLPARPDERPPDGSLRVGLVGRIAPSKGQHVFIAAAARLAADFPEAAFVLGGAPLPGDEAYERELRRHAARAGIAARVRFLGQCNDVWSVYRDLDVVVQASTLPEPDGSAILEAMASRRPLVAAAAGVAPELVEDGRTGVLVEPGDDAALAAVLARLLRSPDERRRLADAARRHVEVSFSLDWDAARIEAVWHQVAGAHRV